MSATSLLRKVYHKLPAGLVHSIQGHLSSVPTGVLYGSEYRNWRRFLDESQFWTAEQREDYEVKKLRETLTAAYQGTVYYKKLFDDCGYDVSAFNYTDQLQQIPFLTKQLIQEHLDELVNKNISSSDRSYSTTGGSTGIPMGMYKPKADAYKESAFVDYIWSAVDFRNTDKVAVLRGSYLGEDGPVQKVGNRLNLSSYHMTDQDMQVQYEALQSFKPKFLHVYPSAISILADFILRKNLEPVSSVEAVLTASENLYPSQRELVEKAFHCRVLDFYGHSEHVCLAGNCEKSNAYHIYWQYGFHELIRPDEDFSDDLKEGDTVEFVGTSFDNPVMPLIRYRTMDSASYSGKKCDCGRNYQLVNSIEGRLQELLITPTGRKISMTAINMHDRVFDHVKQFQFFQDNVNKCVLNVVRNENYSKEDEKGIYREIGAKLGDLHMQIHYVEEIPRTKNGKYRFLVQKLEVR